MALCSAINQLLLEKQFFCLLNIASMHRDLIGLHKCDLASLDRVDRGETQQHSPFCAAISATMLQARRATSAMARRDMVFFVLVEEGRGTEKSCE